MLAIVMLVHNAGRRLEPGLRQLQPVLQLEVPVVLIDAGSQDGSLERLRGFAAEQGAVLLELDQPQLRLDEAAEMARQRTGADYVLPLCGQDLLLPGAVPPLLEMLQRCRPQLAVCGHGWWLAGPGAPLAPPDAARLNADGIRAEALLPDLRRLLPSAGLAARMGSPEPLPGPLGDWRAYDAWLEAAGAVQVFAGPLLLQPLPQTRLAARCGGLAEVLAAAPEGQRPGLLERGLQRLGDEIAMCDPAEAEDAMAAAARLHRSLDQAGRDAAAGMPGPAGLLMRALQQGGEAAVLGVLAQQAAVQDRARLAALAGEIRSLREDLDLALPGPDYLRDLYERVRLG